MKTTINISTFARIFTAYQSCIKSNNDYATSHKEKLEELLKPLPSGSGIDSGVRFDYDNSNPEKLIFRFAFHHMDEGGSYDDWSDHSLIITANLCFGFDMKITGKDRNQVRDYLHDVFSNVFYINPNE